MDKLKITIITEIGIENTCAKEILEFFNIKSEIYNAHLSFTIENSKKVLETLFKFSVLAQSPRKLMSQIAEFEFKDEEDLQEKIKTLLKNDVAKYWFEDNPTFHVRCFHHNSDISSISLEPEIGALFVETFPKLKVSMNEEDVKVLLYINDNKAILGIDLSKREYKLINSNKSIRANIGYHLIRAVDFKQGEILLNPDAKTAEIMIEAALHITGMHNYYESIFSIADLKLFENIDTQELLKKIKTNAKNKLLALKKYKHIFAYSSMLNNVDAGKSNAKVAGVLDLIEFSKVEFDWLDTKFDKGEIDKIVTILPSESKHTKLSQAIKAYTEFLYQVDYILKKTGKIGVLIQKPKGFLDIMEKKQKSLKLISSDKIIIGQLEYYYLIISK